MVKTSFLPTPPVSTYLIAFIVSDFVYKESVVSNTNPVRQRVYTNAQQINQTDYALSEGVKILNAIADYLDVKFSLSKMDQVAIPDFKAGGLN